MTKTGFLPKDKLQDLIGSLTRKYLVYVPCEEGTTVLFNRFDPAKGICFDRPANSSPKNVIYPQSETLFSYCIEKNPETPEKNTVELKEDLNFPETLIFGARPCDAKGFRIFDRVFIDGEYPDPYYRGRRNMTTIVGLACPESYAGCFCTALGSSPVEKDDVDVLMTELEKGYVFEAVTEKGETMLGDSLIQERSAYTTEAQEKRQAIDAKAREVQAAEAVTRIANEEKFQSNDFWDQATDRCISCGACTYLCPTCYCFNITDDKGVSAGERVRSWDSCMFCHFTLETSGHNPRTKKAQRYKNRVGHKFKHYPDKYGGAIQCTGCGRCIRFCPVSMEISEIVRSVNRAEGSEKQTADATSS